MTIPKDTPAIEKTVPEEFDAICDAASGHTYTNLENGEVWHVTSGSADKNMGGVGSSVSSHATLPPPVSDSADQAVRDAIEYLNLCMFDKKKVYDCIEVLIQKAEQSVALENGIVKLCALNGELAQIGYRNAEENQSLHQRVAELEGALEFYANEYTYDPNAVMDREAYESGRVRPDICMIPPIKNDKGKCAKEALSKVGDI